MRYKANRAMQQNGDSQPAASGVRAYVFSLLLLALVCLIVLHPSRSQALPSADGWLLTYVWSPEACQEDLSSDAAQCTEPNGFLPRDLRRSNGNLSGNSCTNEELSRELVARLIEVTSNKIMAKNAWDRYGKCGGLSPTDYVSTIELVDRRIQWPEAYSPQSTSKKIDISQLSQAIEKLNPGLDDHSLKFGCHREWLNQIQFCLDSNYNFDGSACAVASSCPPLVKLRALLPGVHPAGP